MSSHENLFASDALQKSKEEINDEEKVLKEDSEERLSLNEKNVKNTKDGENSSEKPNIDQNNEEKVVKEDSEQIPSLEEKNVENAKDEKSSSENADIDQNNEEEEDSSDKPTIEISQSIGGVDTGKLTLTEENTGISPAKSTTEAGIVMMSDVTDFIEMKKIQSTEQDNGMEFVSSFRLEFSDVVGLSTISPTKAWIHNYHKLKLVDIEKGEVLRSYYSEVPFSFVNGINETTVFLSYNNEIKKLVINEDETNTLVTMLSFSSRIEQSVQCKLNVFSLSKSGDFIACLTRKEGCLCFAKEISYIERFDSGANFIQKSKIQNKGKNLIRQAYRLVENKNGDICIAGEKFQEKGEYWVVVLDSNFRFRFSYDRNSSSQVHIPSSLATDVKHNIFIVNKFLDRIKRKKDCLKNKKKKELRYVAIIDEDGIFRQNLPTDGFSSDGIVDDINIDSDGKIWIITDSGQIIVSIFSKAVDQNGDDK